jgi:Zn-finger nucleic acid-binding protein
MVEIECPLCAESIDLGMAEEGEYECPYCEDVFHWEPDEFRNIENLQCPKGCGQLSYASFNPDRLLKSLATRALMMESGEIGYYECQKCKGSLLNAKNIGTILKVKSDKVGTLESLLEQGVPCDLDCPTCKGKMVEIKVYYEPPNPASGIKGGGSSGLGGIALMLVIAVPVIAYEMSKHNFDEEGKASLILDGCGDCGSFWFDKGEIDRISKARKVGDEMGY